MGFSRQEYCSGLPCPPQGSNLGLLHWQVDSLPLQDQRRPHIPNTGRQRVNSWVLGDLRKCVAIIFSSFKGKLRLPFTQPGNLLYCFQLEKSSAIICHGSSLSKTSASQLKYNASHICNLNISSSHIFKRKRKSLMLIFFFFLVMLHSLRDASSLTRDQTRVSCSRVLTTGLPGKFLIIYFI